MRALKFIFWGVLSILLLLPLSLKATQQPEFSTAGFYSMPETGREVFNMNVGWRFHKGDVPNAGSANFNDEEWPVISLPHGIEYLPIEASGSINYQGVVWYRKHFTPPASVKGKNIFLHFEAIMGHSKIWVNGKLVKEHFGGYLPVIVDVSDELSWDGENVIAVSADNSDNPLYPPGKPQSTLDFVYFGGIYRDCWLVTHNSTYITDPNYEDRVAGGGVFTSFDRVDETLAVINLKTHIKHEEKQSFRGTIEYKFIAPDGKESKTHSRKFSVSPGKSVSLNDKVRLEDPQLWSPETPHLYQLLVEVKDQRGTVVDGFRQKVGVRSIDFTPQDGFVLNGKPYDRPLLGGNRHQDFAVVGNATSNNINWRDAYKLKKAGFNILRLSHYPQDPSFMDACDQLGLFVIVPTPGWQFWNSDPIFGKRVESDIRQMVRRDRNHPSVIFWEPILNETGLWGDAASYDEKVQGYAAEIVAQEYPYKYSYSGGGPESAFPIIYGGTSNPEKVAFIREYGDGINVNDWHGQNAPNRVSLAWGEIPMLIQSQSYSKSLEDLCEAFVETPRNLGGAVWHSLDTQRGYHPDPFYGGILDIFRQPKHAYYMYMAQRSPQEDPNGFDLGPMVYIAHDMNPFSPSDVTVFSNCEEVHLTVYENGKKYKYRQDEEKNPFFTPPILFKDVYSYEGWRDTSRADQLDKVFMLAEGYVDGKLVASHTVRPSNRAEKIILSLDNENVNLIADGSDFVTVVASIVDENGNVKRLNSNSVSFEVEGEGRILGDASSFANPRIATWGTAPVLIQSTTIPGEIKVKASVIFPGARMPVEAEMVFESHAASMPFIHKENEVELIKKQTPSFFNSNRKDVNSKKGDSHDLKEVYKQQDFFMVK